MPERNHRRLLSKNGPTGEYGDLAFHPYNVMLMLVLAAITALFLALSIAFVYTRVENGEQALQIPWLFALNTLFLLGGSFAMWRAKRAFEKDELTTYRFCLRLAFLLTVVFLAFQVLAWTQLFAQNISLASSNSSSYLYLLSGLHFAHVVAGLPFLGWFIIQAKRSTKLPHEVLVYFSDPEKRLKLRLLRIYWHFLDGLWIFLVMFFLVNYWIK